MSGQNQKEKEDVLGTPKFGKGWDPLKHLKPMQQRMAALPFEKHSVIHDVGHWIRQREESEDKTDTFFFQKEEARREVTNKLHATLVEHCDDELRLKLEATLESPGRNAYILFEEIISELVRPKRNPEKTTRELEMAMNSLHQGSTETMPEFATRAKDIAAVSKLNARLKRAASESKSIREVAEEDLPLEVEQSLVRAFRMGISTTRYQVIFHMLISGPKVGEEAKFTRVVSEALNLAYEADQVREREDVKKPRLVAVAETTPFGCRAWAKDGKCPWGERCRFSHDPKSKGGSSSRHKEGSARTTQQVGAKAPCTFCISNPALSANAHTHTAEICSARMLVTLPGK